MAKHWSVVHFEKYLRRQRFLLLKSLLNPLPRPIRILDVGGTFDFWKIVEYDCLGEVNVTLLNVSAEANLPGNFRSVVGDGRCMKAFGPEDFDVVLSNSTIGHVGSFEDQKGMAQEIRRVGRRYFVQTPNYYFPVDWRTLVPFFHFLPIRQQAWWIYHLPVAPFGVAPFGRFSSFSDAVKWAGLVRNLTYRELATLFPDSTIVREQLFGLTKSFMIYRGFERSISYEKVRLCA
jgi:Methyltransferase domain